MRMNLFKRIFIYPIILIIPVIIIAARFAIPIKIGDKAPDFTLVTVKGDSISLNNYKGKVVVIHLWSHTCPHCRLMNQTLPDIVAPYKKSNLAYIMIDIDTDTSGWRGIIKEDKLDFAIQASDPFDGEAKTAIAYNLTGTPCVNVADEKGYLIALNISDVQLKKILKKCFPGAK
jgi:peroxiredoxin